MQFESLKVFCDVARQRSFSQAAAANEITQSAASQIVLQLEKRLGVKLIDRSTRPLQLTREGQVYYDGCRQLVERYLELEADVRNLPAELAPSIQIAAIYSVGLGDMSLFVQRFSAQCPEVETHIEYLHPKRVYERVHDGTADFGLVSFPRSSRDLVASPWRNEVIVLACPPTHRLARHRSVRPVQLAGEQFIGFDKDLMIRRVIDRYLRDHDVSVEVVHEFDNIENIKKAIEVSAGIALLPLPTLGREIGDGSLVAVSLTGSRLVRPLGIIRRRSRPLGAYAQQFVELLQRGLDGNGRALRTSPNGRRPTTPIDGSSHRSHGRLRAIRKDGVK